MSYDVGPIFNILDKHHSCPTEIPMRLMLLLATIASALFWSSRESIAQDRADAGNLLAPYREAAEKKWSKAISDFDKLNRTEKEQAMEAGAGQDAVLFIGSSSIRRWETIETDMAPYRTIRRGYGGAKFTDMAVFVKRLVTPHQYRAIVMFVGNGVVGKDDDHTPDQIESLARYIVQTSHEHQPDAPFFLIEITPCEKRFDAWHKIRAVNARLRELALTTPNTYFIPTASHYLKVDGTPRAELFVDDKLHLNEAGYDLWSGLIRRRLDDVLRMIAVEAAADDEARESQADDSAS